MLKLSQQRPINKNRKATNNGRMSVLVKKTKKQKILATQHFFGIV